MSYKFKAMIIILVASFILQGCATTKTQGKKLAEFGPIARIGVIFKQSSFDLGTVAAYETNQTLSKLAPRLPARLQAVFSTNDIESKVVLGPPRAVAFGADEIALFQSYQYILIISPTSSTYQSYGGHVSIAMDATLIDRTRNNLKVWEGTIVFFKPGLAQVDDNAVDKFAEALLVQLNKNGIIQLKNEKPLLPKS